MAEKDLSTHELTQALTIDGSFNKSIGLCNDTNLTGSLVDLVYRSVLYWSLQQCLLGQPPSQAEARAYAHKTFGSISNKSWDNRVMNRLRKSPFIELEPWPDDKRHHAFVITQQGQQLCAFIAEEMQGLFDPSSAAFRADWGPLVAAMKLDALLTSAAHDFGENRETGTGKMFAYKHLLIMALLRSLQAEPLRQAALKATATELFGILGQKPWEEVLDRLKASSFLDFTPCPDDKRHKQVLHTAEGKRLCYQIKQEIIQSIP